MPNVRCTVSDCTYWDEENVCTAVRIWITVNRFASKGDMEAAELDDVHTQAGRTQATCCYTYKPRAASVGGGEEE